ncbi:FAS1 domain-containing protein [Vanrija pseudolonga]|uniref:FAS1 domain-containing protein n=1 Tax=Vanrija pseudolonga TaxID=143232 RepID=A0AAF0YFW1_9TREE|nr:FAS1 domain-containing protein [Vanrija pseudolonga]
MRRTALALVLFASAAAAFRPVRLPDAVQVSPAPADDPSQFVIQPIDVGTAAPGISLADALTLERKASVWWDYARDVSSVTSRLSNKGKTTVLVPIDKAIFALPRKPHQNPSGSTDDADSKANVEQFLSAHIVPGDLPLPSEETATLNPDVKVKVEGEEGAWVLQPGDIPIVGVTEASNGKILYLDGVVPY